MASSTVGDVCGSCYGQGQVPTDEGPVACPECGGAGVLPTSGVLVEWRAGEIERMLERGRLQQRGHDQSGQSAQIDDDVRWLVFELRRARTALTELLGLVEEMGDDAPLPQMRFIANQALGLYPISAETVDGRASAPGSGPKSSD